MALRGWRRLPGTAERYRDPTGREVSRRQYENIRSQARGWSSWSEYQRVRKSDEYLRLEKRSIEEQNLTRRDIGVGGEFSNRFLRVREARQGGAADLYDPDGPLADLLVYAGLRSEDDWWDVGDTPDWARAT